jgi:acetyl-CoA C-acetyltransferase
MYITGIGKTKFGESNSSIAELAYEAIDKCIKDSNVGIEDVDALFVSNFLGGVQESQLHLNSVISGLFADFTNPSVRIESACASGGVAVFQALRYLKTCNNVLVVGVEKMTQHDGKDTSKNISMAGDRLIDQSVGLTFPASYALIAQQHMLRYGTTLDDLTLVSLKNHQNSELNPLAHFHYN